MTPCAVFPLPREVLTIGRLVPGGRPNLEPAAVHSPGRCTGLPITGRPHILPGDEVTRGLACAAVDLQDMLVFADVA